MDNSLQKKEPLQTPYTSEEFDSKLNAMLAKYGISAKTKNPSQSATIKPKVYKTKMIINACASTHTESINYKPEFRETDLRI